MSTRSRELPSVDEVRRLLAYDPETGALTWKVGRGGTAAGELAGCINRVGYRQLHLNRCNLFAHRVAWVIVHGLWPDRQIDHINGDKADNRIVNLRQVTGFENMQNRGPLRSNRSGFPGVLPYGDGRWSARIKVSGRTHNLGLHDTAEAASAAYEQAKALLHPAWASGIGSAMQP